MIFGKEVIRFMEQTFAPQQEASAAVQADKEKQKQPSRLPMDVMRSLSGADGGADDPMSGGRRISLADAMQAKMQRAFGLDISGVKFYESQKVEDAGAEALARGDTVSFAPGRADFPKRAGFAWARTQPYRQPSPRGSQGRRAPARQRP